MTTPEWLQRRNGDLALAPDGRTWLVRINATPMYKLTPIPVGGRFGCAVMKCVNGKRYDVGVAYPSAEEAVHGGLEKLRAILGW